MEQTQTQIQQQTVDKTPLGIRTRLHEILKNKAYDFQFEFRQNQEKTILMIAHNILNGGKESVILDAPTGTGKSIIAIMVGLILESYGLKGYIITSDLHLQRQYEADLLKFKTNWGSVKGVDNYFCSVNGLKFSNGDCKIRGLGSEKIKSLKCYNDCGYFQARNKASVSNVALLNYSYWLIQRNYVAPKSEKEPFEKRDWVIFDEAHKIDDIVQGHFAPRIDDSVYDMMFQYHNFLQTEIGLPHPDIATPISEYTLRGVIETIRENSDPQIIIDKLKTVEHILFSYVATREGVDKLSREKWGNDVTSKIPHAWITAKQQLDHFKDLHCKFEDYNIILKEFGNENLVKIQGDDFLQFKVLYDQNIILSKLHKQAGYKLIMSATFGKIDQWVKLTSAPDATVISLPNGFSYEKSPIYLCGVPKLSWESKEKNLPIAIETTDSIIASHPGERGIIHCGSYAFAKEIEKKSKYRGRLLFYEGSSDKKDCIEYYMRSKDKILIGPSLIEGLDFKDDLSRFQIFFKVPYLSLGDEFTKRKLAINKDWYAWKTAVAILQGIGRSIRNDKDWAVTYLLETGFNDFIGRNGTLFPQEFHDRLKQYKK